VVLLDNSENSLKKKFGKLKGPLKNYAPYLFLFILTLIVTLITYYRVLIQIEIGPIWDTYDFLSDALVFAGQGMGYADLTRPPLLPFITSIFFRLGYVSPTTIFVVDGFMFIFGVIGFYLLLKLRFNDIESFLGSLLYATFPIVISFVGVGLSDIPSVSFSIWAIYFTVLAVKRNSKFFYLAFPFLMLAFLTRYATAFAIFPMMLYTLINKRLLKDIKDILIGIFASFLFVIPVLSFFYTTFGNPIYSFIKFYGSSSASSPVSPENFAYQPNLLYFVSNFLNYIGCVGIAIILIILLGVVIYTFTKMNKRDGGAEKLLKDHFKIENTVTKIKILILMILLLLFVGTFGKIAYMGSEVLFFVVCYLAYNFLKKLDINGIDMHFLFLSWFMAFFIFHSVYVIKDGRYFITMVPAVSYFLIVGLSWVSNNLDYKIKNRNVTSYIFAIIITLMILSFTTSYLPGIPDANYNLKVMNDNVASASEWLVNYDPNYKNKTIYSDIWPYSGWDLKTNVKMMPIFKDNQTFYCGVKNYSFSPEDSIQSNSYLKTNNVDYYFCTLPGLNLTSYKSIKQFGNVIIYTRLT
jgi:4-amino-4-deoxy-L-arabinose transferase-like glycosyltransferase